MRNRTFIKTICGLLLSALLVFNMGKATTVYALADPVLSPEIAPVFDTDIIRLEDYLHNHVTEPQMEIYYVLLGLYVAAQGGFSEYQLRDPYATQDGVLAWLKSCGIQIYNSLIGMNAIGIDPITGVDYRPYLKSLQDISMGIAVKSTQYQDLNDFVSDVNVQEKYFVPIDFGVQGSLQYVFSKNGGLYNWQFGVSEFTPNLEYKSQVLLPTSNYWALLESFSQPLVRFNANYANYWNVVTNNAFFTRYHNILLNTTDGYLYYYDDNGNNAGINSIRLSLRMLRYDSSFSSGAVSDYVVYVYPRTQYTVLQTYQDIVQDYIDHPTRFCSSDGYLFVTDFVDHFYYGSSWSNKTEIFHNTNLNLDQNSLPYYQQIGNDYLLDIKGILQNLLNTVDLEDVIMNNLYDLTGVVVTDPVLTHVAIEILEEIQTQNVPLPINLNDIADYTDNTYLDIVKDRSTAAGSTLANLVAFWHNCDPELIYAIFGAGIMVLIGAFIGKWGHS